MRVLDSEEMAKLIEEAKKMDPIEGRGFMISIEELHAFACSIVAHHDIYLRKGMHFMELPEKEREFLVRKSLRTVQMAMQKMRED